MPIALSVHKIQDLCDPFESEIWGDDVTKDMVAEAIKKQSYAPEPLHENASPMEHAQRIAFLVAHPVSDPIDIDVGIPALGFYMDWPVVDGNHRLAAAIYSNQETIEVNFQGQLDYGFELFGVDCSDDAPSMTSMCV